MSGIAGPGVDFEQDVEPALGPETDRFTLNGKDFSKKVFLTATQPDDQAKFQALLAKDNGNPVTEEIDGWQVIADKRETIDRYKVAKRSGSLADSDNYKAAITSLPATPLATVYVDGPTLRRALATKAEESATSGSVPDLARGPVPSPGWGESAGWPAP